MPTQQQIDAVVDAVIGAGFTTQQQFQDAMEKLKLEQELSELQSQLNNARDQFDQDEAAFNSQVSDLAALIAAKQAEIDALVA